MLHFHIVLVYTLTYLSHFVCKLASWPPTTLEILVGLAEQMMQLE
jgi:hypothetical protein